MLLDLNQIGLKPCPVISASCRRLLCPLSLSLGVHTLSHLLQPLCSLCSWSSEPWNPPHFSNVWGDERFPHSVSYPTTSGVSHTFFRSRPCTAVAGLLSLSRISHISLLLDFPIPMLLGSPILQCLKYYRATQRSDIPLIYSMLWLLPKGGHGYGLFLFFNTSLYLHDAYLWVVYIFVSPSVTPFWNEEQIVVSKAHITFVSYS